MSHDISLSDVAIVFGPIEHWPGRLRHDAERRHAQFKANWNVTERELRYELSRLGVTDCSILLDVRADQIRLDGKLRAQSKPGHPGVLVVFEHPEAGRLQFAADLYKDRPWTSRDGWRDNVRAVVKTLEALRAVDRHGASSGAAQFRGYAALPAPIAMDGPTHMTTEQAETLLRTLAEMPNAVLTDAGDRKAVIRRARRAAHPDTGGTDEDFVRFQHAVELVDR